MSDIASKLLEQAKPITEDFGLHVWDADFVKEGPTYFLTLYIDKDGGVSIDDCERLSRALDPIVDRLSDASIPAFVFSVSSAGIERRLSKPGHFEKSLGKQVELSFYRPMDGAKSVVGTLAAFDGDAVTLESPAGIKTVYRMADVASAKIHFDF